MDSLYKNGRVRSYILIFLIFASFIISVPLKRHISDVFNNKIESYVVELYEKTGLHITYESLSPSLISSFYIKDIYVLDDDNEHILTINKTKIAYNIFKLLRGDIQAGISSVVIDGIRLDVTQLMEIINKFQRKSSEVEFDYLGFRNLVPENIKLKNIIFIYNDKNVDANLNIKSILVNNNLKKNNLDLHIDAQAGAKIIPFNRNVSSKIEISGTLESILDNSRLNLKFSNLTDGDYKLNKLNFLVVYAKKTLEVHTIQNVNPVSIGADYHFETGDVNLQISADNFSPLSIFTVTSKQKELKKFQNLKISTDTIFKSNLNNKTFDYISDTDFYMPAEIFPGGAKGEISIYGNQNESEITKIKIDGDHCNLSGKLKYIYETFQLSGLIELPFYELNNGTSISTELYIDPLDKGFMIFTPQVFIGNRSLTALQFSMIPRQDSFDFNFELYDYSHPEESDPGIITIDGSLLSKSKYVQSNITLTSLYLDSIVGMASEFVDKNLQEKLGSIKDSLKNYIFSGDVYASTDLKSLSYNVPYVLIANSKKDNQLVMFSLNGTEQNLQLNQLSLVAGKYAMEMAATVDKSPDSSDLFFTIDVNSGTVPYHFAGTFMQDLLNITGDYGTNVEIKFNKDNSIDGELFINNIPLMISENSIILSTDASFNYQEENGPSIQVNLFELEGTNSNISVNPRFVFSGNATKYGAQLNSIAYTDLYSALQGTADVMLNINEEVFDSVGVMANLKNPITDEKITVDFNISNPEHLEFTLDNFKSSYYLNLQVLMNDLGLNRIATQKNENNTISGSLNAFGTVEHPYIALNIEDFSYLFATNFLKGSGNLILEDRDLSINDLSVDYNNMKIEHINAKASITNMNLDANGDLKLKVNNKTIDAPLELKIGNAIIPKGSYIPDSISASLTTTGFSGSFIKKQFPLSISALYSDKTVSFYSSDNGGLNGVYTTDGLLQLSVNNGSFMKFNLDGIVNKDICNLDLYDVDVALGKLCSYLYIDDFISITNGNLGGEVIVTGKIDDPDFSGAASITNGEVILPWLTTQKLKVDDMNYLFNHNEIEMQDTLLSIKSGEKINIHFTFYMNKWELDYIEGFVKNHNKELFPVKMPMNVASLTGNVFVDLKVFMDSEHVEITGSCFGEKVNLNSSVSAVTSFAQNPDDEIQSLPIYADLDIKLGTHASVDFDPILRCVFVPDTRMKVRFDQANNLIDIIGELKLKSGDIAYLNRNFYIKSGTIDFSQSSIENPLITITAETREKDSNGQNVKIIMDVERQHLLDFEPKFSSVPGKSENEIRIMLGQIALADSNNAANFLFAASDYAIQSTVVRQAENKLRDLCNFDIFSVRTNVLQNTLNMGVSGELSKKNLSIGNFLDNTTVYIGKYLGSSLYLDAMLHVSFEDSVSLDDIIAPGKVLFQPEFGMEVEAPFANIRVNMAPDINALLNNQFVPSTSVTLSWKIAF